MNIEADGEIGTNKNRINMNKFKEIAINTCEVAKAKGGGRACR